MFWVLRLELIVNMISNRTFNLYEIIIQKYTNTKRFLNLIYVSW